MFFASFLARGLLSIFIWSTLVATILPATMEIYYLDRINNSQCRSKIETVKSGYGGIISSHEPLNRPYIGDRNCFLMLRAPNGYKIRITVLQFYVNGKKVGTKCPKDSLHFFDKGDELAMESGPGPIRDQFCGHLTNGTELLVSSDNEVTLWWHTDKNLPPNHTAKGFKILWTAFRPPDHKGHCNIAEFHCLSGECINAEMACDNLAHCKDKSDLKHKLQRKNGCENVPDKDILNSLEGAALAGICIGVVLGSVFVCIALLICYRGLCRQKNQPQPHQAPLMVNGYNNTNDHNLKPQDRRPLQV